MKSELTKDEQINYLNNKINYLEANMENEINFGIIISINSMLFILGILLICLNIYLLGIIFFVFAGLLASALLYFNKNIKPDTNSKYKYNIIKK